MDDHEWPGDLDEYARCYTCGLKYSQWTDPETLYCEGGSR
jgi:hypothetical protein